MDDSLRLARSIADGRLFGRAPDAHLAAEVLARSESSWDRDRAIILKALSEPDEVSADEKLEAFDLYDRVATEGAPVVYVLAAACLAVAGLLIWWAA